MPNHPFELPFFSVAYPQTAVSTFRDWGLRSSHGRGWSRTLVATLQSCFHRLPMAFSDTFNHTANQLSIGGLTVGTRFYLPPVRDHDQRNSFLARELNKLARLTLKPTKITEYTIISESIGRYAPLTAAVVPNHK